MVHNLLLEQCRPGGFGVGRLVRTKQRGQRRAKALHPWEYLRPKAILVLNPVTLRFLHAHVARYTPDYSPRKENGCFFHAGWTFKSNHPCARETKPSQRVRECDDYSIVKGAQIHALLERRSQIRSRVGKSCGVRVRWRAMNQRLTFSDVINLALVAKALCKLPRVFCL